LARSIAFGAKSLEIFLSNPNEIIQFLQTFRTPHKQTVDNQDPLYRLYAREGSTGQKLLHSVQKDLTDVKKVCEGELKQTNHLRMLMSSLTKGDVYWSSY
jgi:dynein heavy chain 1